MYKDDVSIICVILEAFVLILICVLYKMLEVNVDSILCDGTILQYRTDGAYRDNFFKLLKCHASENKLPKLSNS
jgi:hypothetical protein